MTGWMVVAAGDNGEQWWIAVIKSLIVINLVLFGFAYLTLVERKVMGRMQLRYGPNRAGPYGLLQPIADLGDSCSARTTRPRDSNSEFCSVQHQETRPNK